MGKRNEPVTSPYISEHFLAILEQYYSERLAQEKTEQQYIYVFNSLCNYAQCDFLDITQEQIKDYFLQSKDSSAVKSTDYSLSVMRAVSRYMDQNADKFHIQPRYLALFSVIDVIFPDMQFNSEDLPNLDSVDKVLSYFKQEGDMVGFLSCSMVLRCALTTNEMVKMERNMFLQDANGNYGIRMQLTNHATRFVKIPDDIADLIKQYALQRTDRLPNLFLNKKGKPISARALQNRLLEACQESGVKPFTYNELRTLNQAMMIKSGASLEKIAQYVNLKQTDWFFRYNRVVEELEDSAVDYVHIKVEW